MSKKWELKFDEAKGLRKQGAALLHKRISLLKEVYDDGDFKRWCQESGTVDLDFLDDHLEDVGYNYVTLAAVLEQYPDEAEWQKHNVRELCAMVIEAQRAEKYPGERTNWKARAAALESEVERLRNELQETKELLSSFRRLESASK